MSSNPRIPRQDCRAVRGAFLPGLVAGLLIGLALALGVALYVTKVPVPFVDKVPQRSAESDAEEARRNKDWNPNAALGSKAPRPQAPSPEKEADADTGQASQGATPVPPGPAVATTPTATTQPPSPQASGTAPAPAASKRDPAAILAGAPAVAPKPADVVTSTVRAGTAPGAGKEAFLYFVQAGAFVRLEDAQVQRAKLAMVGQESRVMEREQAGRTVHRVRVGPFESSTQAQEIRDRLAAAGFDVTLVRVERSTP